MVLILDALKDDNIECILSCLSDITSDLEELKIIHKRYKDLLKIFDNIYKYKLVCTSFHKFYDNNYIQRLKKRINYYYLRNFIDDSDTFGHPLFGSHRSMILNSMFEFIPEEEKLGCSCKYSCFAISSNNLIVIEPFCRGVRRVKDHAYIINIYSIHDERNKVIRRAGRIVKDNGIPRHTLNVDIFYEILSKEDIKIYEVDHRTTWIGIK